MFVSLNQHIINPFLFTALQKISSGAALLNIKVVAIPGAWAIYSTVSIFNTCLCLL